MSEGIASNFFPSPPSFLLRIILICYIPSAPWMRTIRTSGRLSLRLHVVAADADRLKVLHRVGATLGLRHDVVHLIGLGDPTGVPAGLT